MTDQRGEIEADAAGSADAVGSAAGAGPGGPSRRGLFLGAGAIGATAVLAACGGDGPPVTGGPGGNPGGDPGGGPGGGQPEEDPVLATTGEVEVGGGVIVATKGVVVTQPVAGEFKGFSAACTHQGCFVSSISNGLINCACHGSQYSIEDGSVVRSAPELTPQTQNPLPEVEITVDGDQILRA